MYLSYFGGSTTNQRGPWLSWLDEIFGVRHTLRYGLVEPIEDDIVEFKFVEPFGDIPEGTTPRSGLRASTVRVAISRSNRPEPRRRRRRAWAASPPSHSLGSGSTILCTYPLEHMAARTPG